MQYSKASIPRVSTLSGIVISARLVHSLNAPIPMFATLSGIDTPVRPEQPANTNPPIRATPSEITRVPSSDTSLAVM